MQVFRDPLRRVISVRDVHTSSEFPSAGSHDPLQ